MLNKVTYTTIGAFWTVIVALYPVASFLDNRYAHAEDFERSKARIILDIRETDLDYKQEINQLQMDRFTDQIQSGKPLRPDQEVQFDELQTKRNIYLRREVDLEKYRQELE